MKRNELIVLASVTLNSEYAGMIRAAYTVISRAVLAGSIVGIAVLALRMLLSDADSAARARSGILRILIAAACVLLLPAVISLGVSMFSGLGWEPGHMRQG